VIERLADLELFTRIVEAGSLSAAARSLGTTQPTVSKHLAAMERQLGVRLLQRSTRRLRLTEEGQAWYDACRRWMGELREVSGSLTRTGHGPSGTLRLNAPVALGRVVVAPLVRRFLELHPGLAVDLTLTDHRVDLVLDNVDVAVRIGAIGNPSVVARPLFSYRTRLVAAPAYLAAHGTPRTLEDLRAHPVLFYGTPSTEDLESPAGRVRLLEQSRLRTNDSFTFVDALEAGLGLGLTSPWLTEPGIARGTLVRVLPDAWGQRFTAHAVYLPSRVLPARVRAFVAFLQRELPGAVGRWPGVTLRSSHSAVE
jgi:DNA-binding transcriptional LysR family regulator